MKQIVKELEETQSILLKHVKKPGPEKVSLENAAERVVFSNLHAPFALPSFNKSPLDGFALNSLDTRGATQDSPVFIEIIDEAQAGDTRNDLRLRQKTGVKVMTGAPLPAGADAVIRKEEVYYSHGRIKLERELSHNTDVILAGSDVKQGEIICKKGDYLTPYHIGLLAALGIQEIDVYKKPIFGIISTGSELKKQGEPLSYGQIYNSNHYSLAALVKLLGGDACSFGTVADSTSKIRELLETALNGCDVVITTGGVSVGECDLVRSAVEDLGAEVLYSRINIKPGTPSMAALKDGKLIISLSGNPAAALISFELLLRPYIHFIKGCQEEPPLKAVEGVLIDGFHKSSRQRRFLRVRAAYEGNKWVARQTGSQDTGILKSMLGCNALVDIPAGSPPIHPGGTVRIVLL